MDFEITIDLLNAEIDSLKDAYKTYSDKDVKTIYSSRILEHKKAITLLKQSQALQLLQTDVSGSFDKLIDNFKLETDLVWYKNPNTFREWANDR
jgi:hypothetical protein